MFTQDQASTFALPDGYDKLDKLGDVYFPQLGAMLIKAKHLISAIYGIQPDDTYFVSKAPINSKGRKESATFKASRNNANQVTVGLRAKGVPAVLTQPNGKACQFHFATLSFGLNGDDSDPFIGVGFDPYILTYHQQHKDAFADAVAQLGLGKVFADLGTEPQPFGKTSDIPSLMRQRKALLLSPFIQGVDPDMQDLATMVILFVGMFPLLDVFTRISNGERVEGLLYMQQWRRWLREDMRAYAANFTIAPLTTSATKVAESQVRGYFETLLGHKFPTERPEWLTSKTTGANLELDGYCPELKLAFEYQGEYHYFPVLPHNKNKSVEDVQKNDAYKATVCKRRGVSLIQVPYTEKDNQSFVVQALLSLGRPEITQLLGSS
jgi:hypothetical protein